MSNPDDTMAGKVCLVTGATAGIGAVTALALARRGATVGLVGRSAERVGATARRIADQTGNSSVVPFLADLSVQTEVRRLAEEFRAQFPRLDVLVNNAGAMFLKRQESVDGIEMTFALNHLAYFLLTNLLLDRLKAARPHGSSASRPMRTDSRRRSISTTSRAASVTAASGSMGSRSSPTSSSASSWRGGWRERPSRSTPSTRGSSPPIFSRGTT